MKELEIRPMEEDDAVAMLALVEALPEFHRTEAKRAGIQGTLEEVRALAGAFPMLRATIVAEREGEIEAVGSYWRFDGPASEAMIWTKEDCKKGVATKMMTTLLTIGKHFGMKSFLIKVPAERKDLLDEFCNTPGCTTEVRPLSEGRESLIMLEIGGA